MNDQDRIKQLEAELAEARAAIDRLATLNAKLSLERTEEVDRIKAESARLSDELESHAWEVSPAMAHAKIDELNRENARLAAGLYLCAEQMRPQYDTTQSREKIARLKKMVKNDTATALDDLLGPVVELLTMLEQREHSRDGASHLWKLIDIQLTRLRALVERKP